jgi:hypothetical protein
LVAFSWPAIQEALLRNLKRKQPSSTQMQNTKLLRQAMRILQQLSGMHLQRTAGVGNVQRRDVNRVTAKIATFALQKVLQPQSVAVVCAVLTGAKAVARDAMFASSIFQK